MPRVSTRSNKGVHSQRNNHEQEEEEDIQIQNVKKLNNGTNNKKQSTKEDDDEEFEPKEEKKEEHQEENDDDLEDGDIRCGPCGATTENYDEDNDPHGAMVFCEICKNWQHLKCMGLRKNSKLDDYKCDICSGNPRPPLRKRSSSSVSNNEEQPTKKRATTSTKRASTKKESNSKATASNTTKKNQSKEIKETGPFDYLKVPLRISTAKAFFNFLRRLLFAKNEIEEPKPSNSNNDTTTSTDEPSKPEDPTKQKLEQELINKAQNLAIKIEEIISNKFTKQAYSDEGRRILFILKKGLGEELISDELTVEELMNKTPQDLNADIVRIEQQNKANIKNIVLVENDQTQIVRRTHKGEIIKENENNFISQMDESINARKVDHRRFSQDIENLNSKIIDTKHNEKIAYNNSNPRLEDDDSSDEEVQSDIDLDRDDDDEEVTKNQHHHHNNNNQSPPIHHDEQGSVTESLSDNPQNTTPDENNLKEFLSNESTNNNEHTTTTKKPSLSPTLSSESTTTTTPNLQKPLQELWQGSLTFPDLAHFKAKSYYYSSTDYINIPTTSTYQNSTNIAKNIFQDLRYTIQGKLNKEKCEKYLNEILTKRNLYFIEIKPNNEFYKDDLTKQTKNQKNFDTLYHYLLKYNKVGVLNNKPNFVKDSYLMSIDFRDYNLSKNFKKHKTSEKIGLFAVFVVSKDYKPTSENAVDDDNMEDVRIGYNYPPNPSSSSQSKNQNLESILSNLN
ncbi:BYE1 [Candida jiufengensis]|uniref:BYE1 n=1 Tax=Candida jiufengensis TaxID=497108 RepID=UPI0022250277|nr:BYE1 [Candida jiufengensis]KAI5956254.1 BYE1 [Candida jiufengensis]